MKLWETILANVVKEFEWEMLAGVDVEKLFEKECYIVLERIEAILEDDRLDDNDCFEKIERIVCLFEEIGSDCGARHDFG